MAGVTVEPALVERYLEELAQHGRHPGGGWFRPVYSRPWLAAQRQILDWFDQVGLESRIDPTGTVCGRLAGREPGPALLTGSHFDTVPHGGRFDGAAGVVAAMAAVQTLRERYGQPRRSLEVVGFCEEEGSRYHANMWGSRALAGLLRPDDLDRLVDDEGVKIGDAMRQVGLDPARLEAARRTDIAGFLELHIEQGGVLEAEGVQIGLVEAITGITTLRVHVGGRADHAGTTPMDLRRDAYVGAAAMALGIERIAVALGRPAVATVGSVHVQPGVRNIVPREVVFTIDARHAVPEQKAGLVRRIVDLCHETAAERRLTVAIEPLTDKPPALMDPELVATLELAAQDCGVTYRRMVSGAGHDAQTLSNRFPAVMLFVPSHEGRSHSPAEQTSLADLTRGVAVLATALRRLAY